MLSVCAVYNNLFQENDYMVIENDYFTIEDVYSVGQFSQLKERLSSSCISTLQVNTFSISTSAKHLVKHVLLAY